MKTFGRILVIVVAFAVVMGLMYFTVNGSSNNSNTQSFDRPQFQGDGFNPNGPRPEFRGERDGGGGFGWIAGMIKNIGIVAVLVALIVLPKNFLQQQRREAVTVPVNE